MEAIEEEFTKTQNIRTTNNDSISSNTKTVESNNHDSDSNQYNNCNEPEISSKTPLLVVSSPDDELSEKLTKLSSNSAYRRGFSGIFVRYFYHSIVYISLNHHGQYL